MDGLVMRGVWASYARAPWSRATKSDQAPFVLEDVSLEVEAARPCALVGPNGAGKSSLVRVLAGLLPASRGTVEVLGKDVARLDRREIARLVAVVPQITEVGEAFTVREVVAMGRAPHQDRWMRPSPGDDEAVERAIATCELEDMADRLATELSGGEQRRVAIARALAQDAPVLLLDEPASHLDVRHAAATWSLVTRACRERRLVCMAVVHDLSAAARFASDVVLMSRGRVAAAGAPRDVLTPERLKEVFGTTIDVSDGPDGLPVFVAGR